MKITVLGSLGNIGKPLTLTLVQKGHSVTVISSNPKRQKDIEALGAAAAIGLIENVDFLTSAFTGADVVYAMIPPKNSVPDPMARHINLGNCLAQAIDQSGVKRVVYVSSYGAQLNKGTGLIVGHHHIENALNRLSGLETITHLRVTFIYYNLYAYVNMIKTTGVISANYGDDDRVVLVSPKDIAAASVEEIEANTTGKKIKYVASDERTCNEIARVLGKAIGKPDLKWVTITDEQMQNGMEANGVPAPVAARFVEMFGACHHGLLNEDYDLNKPENMGKIKLEDFAKEFAAAF
ncbi:NmrA family NAD(P)-binding protein [Mucilaginibacter sabulilitoris]|uniref:NmrA family NAD(P)-binding protein n=1 Tax=Mucilaginibacter sabulilitoris TaxID=1173583 RepID=A0ABZ0TSX8_9SPHI|nr:NmrA family NAD(P)-binding protein [Mucilaginibacter sabulilitoris]WPU96091.1 NmrA family NAD(P)-binding protein [Mucilaginibacter sabulilitoris]